MTIGRRVYFRTEGGVRAELSVSTYTAVYKDADGTWRQDALGTTNKREARRKAIEIQQRLDGGQARPRAELVELLPLIDRYEAFCRAKGLAPKSLSKYKADLDKLRRFAAAARVRTLAQFNAEMFYRYREWLIGRKHKQGVAYAPKSVYATLTLAKQLCKWAWQQQITSTYLLVGVPLPTAKARPQPCFTTTQVESLIEKAEGTSKAAIAILAYSGMRIGELEQLLWQDVRLDRGSLGMFHIRRGGSNGGTKDKDERFVPIHPRIRPMIEALPRSGELVLPGVTERRLLDTLKRLCRGCGFGASFKLHSFRHHFASMCANHSVAYRKALAWLGHSSSDILDLYYHLHDDESESAMMALADSRHRNGR
ncbi:MAG: site-specific integrase [Phycisphaerales bacterium]|nr:site-specific integrase [Phycisphaerales bacterium]